MVAVPTGFEDRVGEAQSEDVLHRLLAEEVIDPVDPVLLGHRRDGGLEARALSRSVPNGFSMMSRASSARPSRPSIVIIDSIAVGGTDR